LNSHLLKTIALKKTRFTEMLIEENGLDRNGFDSWLFCPGMLFSSPEKWWGDHGRRDFPHEGIDLCLYRDHYGRTLRLDEKSRIPVMHDGVVRAIFTDYLGKAVIIEHETPESGNGRFLSVYAHTKPRANVKIGAKVKEGDIIATIADTSRSKANIIPHLHFSLGLPSPSLSFDPFVWNLMRNPDLITLLDPLEVIDWPYQQLDSENPYCFEL
jgi:murein DD-endopeptidase MepM/ murein hydrolase activator NlpD